jgi:hypothetical protein
MRMGHRTIILVTVLVAFPLVGRSPKEPWQLTVEERISLRTDPQLARERVRKDRAAQPPRTPESLARAAVVADTFDGRTHPELFLPHQVFDQLVKMAFLRPDRTSQVVQKGFMPEIRRHGLPPDFWMRLESLSTIYLADYRAVSDLLESQRLQQSPAGRERIEKALVLRQTDACRSRAAALAAARKEFGRERFDRFLYQVVAVGMFTVTDRLPDPKLLRQAEEGCQ